MLLCCYYDAINVSWDRHPCYLRFKQTKLNLKIAIIYILPTYLILINNIWNYLIEK